MGGRGPLENRTVIVSLITVTYRSAEVLPACLASFRREAAAAGVDAEAVAVDHSEDAAEAAVLRRMDIETVLVMPNRGYAAGINAGVAAASGEIIVIANPDVEFLPGSLAGLLNGLEAGFTVVGPKLVWDLEGRVFLPVPEDPSPRRELDRLRRLRSQQAWERWITGAVSEMWRLWTADSIEEAPMLRGPCLAVRRPDFVSLGPWDEGYFLYYEETDWLWRARRRGARLGLAGDAAVCHHWGQATRHLDTRAQIEEASRNRFVKKTYGPWWRFRLRRARARVTDAGAEAVRIPSPRELPRADARLWLLSPYKHLLPAAGWLGDGPLPSVIASRTGEQTWWAAAVDGEPGRWRLAGTWMWGDEG